jgi:hypothetical protein
MMAKDQKTHQPRPTAEGPVRLEAWLAANQPRLHPTQRKVLQAVADLSAGGAQVPSSTVRERLGMSQQLLNRHLRALEASGLVQLESPGAGLPLLARTSGLGLRALGLRGPQPAAKPENEPAAQPGEPLAQLAPPPGQSAGQAAGQAASLGLASSRERLLRFIDRLYQDLTPYLADLSHEAFRRLVGGAASQALGKAATPAEPAAPAAPLPGAALGHLVAQHMGPAPVRPAGESGPELNPVEMALEDRLEQSVHPSHRHAAWWERTKELCAVWDQMRRHRLGVLGTYFTSFGPRWRHPDWDHFNRARRQADARGASYQDWVTAQFDRLGSKDQGQVGPADLHGDEAAQAWQMLRQDQAQAQGRQIPGPPPYTPDSFNVHNPDHAAYAEELLEEISFLASRVYGDEPDGPIRLLAQAVSQGTVPMQALDLRPAWKERVLAALGPAGGPRRPAQAGPNEGGRGASGATSPPIII